MNKYYTRACNFYFGSTSKENIKKKLSIPLNGNILIYFDHVEIIKRENRIGDHIWYVSSMKKFKRHYPKWKQKYNTNKIIDELIKNFDY